MGAGGWGGGDMVRDEREATVAVAASNGQVFSQFYMLLGKGFSDMDLSLLS